MEIKIPAAAEEIIRKLNERGYEAYVVGGCVRDMLLGREPKDWDITTSALPGQVKEVFPRTVDTGLLHGTVTVMMGREGYEVTTYRVDGEYTDGRHPDSVEFTSSLTEDLKRRDFTINAMAYNSQAGLVDEFGGAEDLRRKVIRCVGEPMDRFTEDALRILRAVRFSAQLGFSIEERTYNVISVIAPNMAHVSRERIQAELTKLLLSSHPDVIELVCRTGMSSYVSERFCQAAFGNGQGAPAIPASIPARKHLRWAALLRNTSPDSAAAVLRDLKMDNDTMNKTRLLVEWAGKPVGQDKISIRRAMSRMEPEIFDDLLTLKLCLAKDAPGPGQESLSLLLDARSLADEIRKDGDCVSLKSLAVNGRDVMETGIKPGKEVGRALDWLLELVLKEPSCNTKDQLLTRLREIM